VGERARERGGEWARKGKRRRLEGKRQHQQGKNKQNRNIKCGRCFLSHMFRHTRMHLLIVRSHPGKNLAKHICIFVATIIFANIQQMPMNATMRFDFVITNALT
jgi:hypothetical protein